MVEYCYQLILINLTKMLNETEIFSNSNVFNCGLRALSYRYYVHVFIFECVFLLDFYGK